MKKLFLSLSFVAFLAFASSARADSGVYGGYGAPCQPIYGGGETCVSTGNILINKTVLNPQTKIFVDNLSLSTDPKYQVGQTVQFKLNLVNTGEKTLGEVKVTDIFPAFLKFTSGPGTYNSKTRELTFKVFNLKSNETRTFILEAKVSDLPSDKAVNCVVNQVKAVSDNNESSDISQVCLEKTIATTKGGLPILPAPQLKQTPATGPEMLGLIGLIPAGLGGLLLRRKTSR